MACMLSPDADMTWGKSSRLSYNGCSRYTLRRRDTAQHHHILMQLQVSALVILRQLCRPIASVELWRQSGIACRPSATEGRRTSRQLVSAQHFVSASGCYLYQASPPALKHVLNREWLPQVLCAQALSVIPCCYFRANGVLFTCNLHRIRKAACKQHQQRNQVHT